MPFSNLGLQAQGPHRLDLLHMLQAPRANEDALLCQNPMQKMMALNLKLKLWIVNTLSQNHHGRECFNMVNLALFHVVVG